MIRSLLLALVAALVLGSSSVGAAPPPLPSGGSTAGSTENQPLDLAAMMLLPEDLPAAGFGWDWSDVYGVSAFSTLDKIELQTAGFVRGHEIMYTIATSTAADDLEQQVRVTIDLFEDAEGAEAGFNALSTFENPDIVETGVSGEIGEASALLRQHDYQDSYSEGNTGEMAILVFRTGPIVASIFAFDWTGAEPDDSAMLKMGETLAGNIDEGLRGDGPGLSAKIVRLDVNYQLSAYDGYWLIDGKGIPTWNDTDERLAKRLSSYEGADAVYGVSQSISQEQGAPIVGWRAVEFPDSAAASDWVEQYLDQLAANGDWRLTPDAGASTYGDSSRTAAYEYQTSDGDTFYGMAIVTHFGSLGVALMIEARDEVPVSIAEALMETEVDCVAGPDPCPVVPVPEELTQLGAS
jgi:hypothetical protein